MTTYNHMFTVAFSVETTHTGAEDDRVPAEELKAALLSRIADLDTHHEWHEATGAPDDTYVVTHVKYLLVPGLVRSKTDGNSHFVQASRLAQLYGVQMGECYVLPKAHPNNTITRRNLLERAQRGELIALVPRDDGKYELPKGADHD